MNKENVNIIVFCVNKNKETTMKTTELKEYLGDINDKYKHKKILINTKYDNRIRLKLDDVIFILTADNIRYWYNEFIPKFSYGLRKWKKWE